MLKETKKPEGTYLTKSLLCVLLLKHPEYTVPRNISRTLQFDLNANKTESISQPRLKCLAT
jgi:hypothetical protein